MTTSAFRTRGAGHARQIALALGALLLVAGAPEARATPGVPDPPVPLFSEHFENVSTPAAVLVPLYTGPPPFNVIYQADNAWTGNISFCNGVVISFASNPSGCEGGGDPAIKAVAQKLGVMNGAPAPNDNHAVGEHTDADPAPVHDDVELRTAEPIALPAAPGHYIVGGIDVAVLACAAGSPLFSFVLTDQTPGPPSVDHNLSPEPQSACEQSADVGDGMRGGTLYSDASVFSNFTDMTLAIHNANHGPGSYHGLDNLVIADATPKLDQGFLPATVTPGATSTLTLTITNTSDLAAKDGWSLSGELPSTLQVTSGATAPSPAVRAFTRATTCPGTTVTAPTGGHSIAASGGLSSGQASCTVTIGVTSSTTGSVTSAGSGFVTTGLRAPGSATVTFANPAAATPPPAPPAQPACSDGLDNDGDGLVDANDPGCVLGGVYTPQKDSEASIAALAQCAAGALQLTDVFGRNGRTVLRGVAGPDHVGKRVTIVSTADGKTAATAVVQGDLSFATTAKLPPRAIRDTNEARYQARLGTKRSLSLKFARRMTETVASRLAATRVKIGGRVTKPLALPRATIVVRAAPSCQSAQRFRGVVVARNVKVKSSGAWSATIALPAALRGDKVFLRAQTRVRVTTRSPRTAATYTLIQGVTLR